MGYLQGEELIVNNHILGEEICAKSRSVLVRKSLIHKLMHEGGLSNAGSHTIKSKSNILDTWISRVREPDIKTSHGAALGTAIFGQPKVPPCAPSHSCVKFVQHIGIHV